MSSEEKKEPQFVPIAEYVEVVEKLKDSLTEKEKLNTEVLQLREALKSVQNGMTKASQVISAFEVFGRQNITDIGFEILKTTKANPGDFGLRVIEGRDGKPRIEVIKKD